MCGKNANIKIKWIYLFRQLLISTGVWTSFFILGLNIGTPTVLVPQLRNEANSTDAVTPEQASWLPAIVSYCAIPWIIFTPIIAAHFGKKITVIFVFTSALIGYINFYFSSDVKQIFISGPFHAVVAAFTSVAISIITEYTSPEYRGFFLTINFATLYWGILCANSIGTFCHWRKIPLLGLICTVYNLVTVYFWPESPLWLMKKGRFDQGVASHRWLKGSAERSEYELQKLLADNQKTRKQSPFKEKIISGVKTIVKKEVYKPMLLSVALTGLSVFSGKLICTVYAIDILKKITNSTTTAYTGTLILDSVTVLTMYIGCALAKAYKRRHLLFTTTVIAVSFLFIFSLYLFLVKSNVIFENKYVSISLLVGYTVSIATGPMILTTTISGELIPIESRSLSLCALGLTIEFCFGSMMKLAPYIFEYFGMHGTFFFFGISSVMLLVILYYYLPETKDKVLQDIGDDFKETTPLEEAKELLSTDKNNIKIVSRNDNNHLYREISVRCNNI